MGSALDLTGHRYGQLMVAGLVSRVDGKSLWRCICDCGSEATVWLSNLRSNHTTSCGCGRRAASAKVNLSHGMAAGGVAPELRSYYKAKARCTDVNDKNFAEYGGRGIEMCREWLESPSAFLEHMGSRPSRNHSLDRIDVNGNYEPGNCRWATPKEQANNRRPRRWQKRPVETSSTA